MWTESRRRSGAVNGAAMSQYLRVVARTRPGLSRFRGRCSHRPDDERYDNSAWLLRRIRDKVVSKSPRTPASLKPRDLSSSAFAVDPAVVGAPAIIAFRRRDHLITKVGTAKVSFTRRTMSRVGASPFLPSPFGARGDGRVRPRAAFVRMALSILVGAIVSGQCLWPSRWDRGRAVEEEEYLAA